VSDGGRRRTYIVVELLIVTTGILLALSIDGGRQWFADRRLLTDARANLNTEIRGNIKELREFMDSSGKRLDKLAETRDVIRELLDGKPLRANSLEVTAGFPSLSSASRRSAQVTGAFGLMPYEEVAKYEQAYSLQDQFERMLGQTLEVLAGALPPGDPETLSRRELEVTNESLNRLIASLYLQQNIGPQLLQRYQDALGETPAK
jgi:hypothetical protein